MKQVYLSVQGWGPLTVEWPDFFFKDDGALNQLLVKAALDQFIEQHAAKEFQRENIAAMNRLAAALEGAARKKDVP